MGSDPKNSLAQTFMKIVRFVEFVKNFDRHFGSAILYFETSRTVRELRTTKRVNDSRVVKPL